MNIFKTLWAFLTGKHEPRIRCPDRYRSQVMNAKLVAEEAMCMPWAGQTMVVSAKPGIKKIGWMWCGVLPGTNELCGAYCESESKSKQHITLYVDPDGGETDIECVHEWCEAIMYSRPSIFGKLTREQRHAFVREHGVYARADIEMMERV